MIKQNIAGDPPIIVSFEDIDPTPQQIYGRITLQRPEINSEYTTQWAIYVSSDGLSKYGEAIAVLPKSLLSYDMPLGTKTCNHNLFFL